MERVIADARTRFRLLAALQGDELRALRELRRQTEGAFVFGSERGGLQPRRCRPMDKARASLSPTVAIRTSRNSLPMDYGS